MGAYLQGAVLLDTHLQGTNVMGEYLQEASLQDAHLQGTDLRGAHLEKANFLVAHLEGADLWGAYLQGADLSRARGLTQEQIEQAYGNENTKLPEGLQLPAAWG